jgi:hypothetical protein
MRSLRNQGVAEVSVRLGEVWFEIDGPMPGRLRLAVLSLRTQGVADVGVEPENGTSLVLIR